VADYKTNDGIGVRHGLVYESPTIQEAGLVINPAVFAPVTMVK
jgi:hypothetical protein